MNHLMTKSLLDKIKLFTLNKEIKRMKKGK